jgi:hypothetical protein
MRKRTMLEMSRFLIVAFLISIITYLGCAPINVSNAQTGTTVNGVIQSNTTWTKANGPYVFAGPLGIAVGAVLTIEPGVVLKLGVLQVNGTLHAVGSSSDPIYIDGEGGSITFTSSSVDWNEQTHSGSIVENLISTESNYFGISINASPKLNKNSINASIGIDGGSPIISNNTIAGVGGGGVININGGSPVISKNTLTAVTFFDSYGRPQQFPECGINLAGDCSTVISDNVVFKGIKIDSGMAIIQRNLITGSNKGIVIDGGTKIAVQNNTIANNTLVGIAVNVNLPSTALSIGFNNFQDNNAVNKGRNIDLGSGAEPTTVDVNATYNWWGSANEFSIEDTIYDLGDDFRLGKVTFMPFLAEPNPQAMPDPNAPSPTILPSSTPAQSASPSQSPAEIASPTLNPTASPDQSSGQGVSWGLFYGVVAVFVVVVAVLAVAVAVLLRRTRRATGS